MPRYIPDYKRQHVIDTVINDESCSRGRDVTIHVDSFGMVNIEFGSSMTIRTDEQGLNELRESLDRTSAALRYIQSSEENTAGWPS